ncbi:MAG: primase, partial [Polaromonas sp.]|nr:primase [Polaromonas sp.]
PVIKGQDMGIWRRVLLVPYQARFASREDVVAGRAHFIKDTRIMDRLAGEKQGVLAWVVRGAMAWFIDGLQAPDAVLAASKDYQAGQDRVLQFVSEVCELGAEFSEPLTVGMGGIYPTYVGWCKESGFFPLAKNRFLGELARIVPFYAVEKSKLKNDNGRRREVFLVQGVRLLDAD